MIIIDMQRGRPAIYPRTPFGERLAAAREHAGITQTQLGEKLGLSQRAIANWERRKTQAIRPGQLQKISEILHISVELLVQGNVKPPKPSNGPRGRVRQVFEDVSKLPRRQQQKVIEFVGAFVRQNMTKA